MGGVGASSGEIDMLAGPGGAAGGRGGGGGVLNMHDDPYKMLMMNNQLHHDDCKWVNQTLPTLTLCFGSSPCEPPLALFTRSLTHSFIYLFLILFFSSCSCSSCSPPAVSCLSSPLLLAARRRWSGGEKMKSSDRCLLLAEFSRPLRLPACRLPGGVAASCSAH